MDNEELLRLKVLRLRKENVELKIIILNQQLAEITRALAEAEQPPDIGR